MEYARLGSTGMKVSRICLGCMGFGDAERWVHKWVLNEENSRPIIKKALELGINFFDTANVYSIGASEEILGRALKDFAKRDEVVIATKVHGKMREGPNGAGLSRKAILSEIDNSLKRLGTDYVDLYHDPSLGLRNPHRGDDGSAERCGAGGQGALHRRLGHVRLAVPEGAARCREAWLDPLRLDAGSPEPDLPRRGAGDAAALPRGEDRGDPVQPARLGQVDARLVGGKHAALRDRSESRGASTMRPPSEPIDRSWSGSRKSRRSMGSRARISRWPGCCRRSR